MLTVPILSWSSYHIERAVTWYFLPRRKWWALQLQKTHWEPGVEAETRQRTKAETKAAYVDRPVGSHFWVSLWFLGQGGMLRAPQGQWLPATAQAAPKLPAGRAGDFSQLPFSQWLKFFMEFSSINQLSIFKSLGPRTFSEQFACQPCSKEWELSLPFRNLSSDSAMGSSLQRSPELPRPTPGTLFQQPHFCWQMLTSLENDSFTFNFCFPKALIPGYQVIDGTWVRIPYSVRVQEKQLSSSFPCPVRCAGTTDVASITSQRAEVTPSPTPEPALPALFPINGSVLTEGRHWYSHLVFEYESLQSSL